MRQTSLITLRLDKSTADILQNIMSSMDTTKSHVVRHSIRLLNELLRFKNSDGEVIFRTPGGEHNLILLN